MSWGTLLLGEMIERDEIALQTGPFGTQLRASDYTESGTPVINVRNIGYGELWPEKLEYVPDSVVSRLGKHLLLPDDIVFGRKGAVDRHLLVGNEQSGWMQGSDCIRLRLNSETILPRFLSNALKLESHKQWMLTQCGNKATMASLNQDVISRIALHIPDIAIQRRIIGILSSYDDLIENNRRRIQLLEQSARLLYKEWFINLRFPGHEHVKIVDGVPEGWKREKIGDVIPFNYGKAIKEDDRVPGMVPVYGSSGIVGYHEKAIVEGPTIIIGRKGNVGSVFWSPVDCHPIDTVYYIESARCSLFMYYALKSMIFISTDVAVPGLNRDFAHSRLLLIPDHRFLQLFAGIVDPIHKEIDVLNTTNKSLTRARDLLLPRLMNGEILV